MPMHLPKGFRYSGVTAGIKESKSKDLGLIFAEEPSLMGAVYTQNRFPSAHVLYDRKLTPNMEFRALVVNSGNANAATGKQGERTNLAMAESVARALGVKSNQVLTGSTGVIGEHLPLDLIEKTIPELVEKLEEDPKPFAEAIMTTDLKVKMVSMAFDWAGQEYSLLGIAKGSGMIHPNMATMLGYILTDAPIPAEAIQAITAKAADDSFNSLSVDGDCSTNDSFHLITSNRGEVPTEAREAYFKHLQNRITDIARQLAKKIAADGEGAEHLLVVKVQGGSDDAEAKSVMTSILTSSLVKTAVHGRDPNWGRILMATGNGLTTDRDNLPIDIQIQGMQVFKEGEPLLFDREGLSEKLGQFEVVIEVDLKLGPGTSEGYGCDFSKEYVTINADYST